MVKKTICSACASTLVTACALATSPAFAQNGGPAGPNECGALPNYAALKAALINAVAASGNGGLGLPMWATLVDRTGVVCAVAFSGSTVGSQWFGSRVISAQKANTANAFSLDGLALSTANLYAAVQPGGSLYGLQHSNPVDPSVAYQGPRQRFGTPNDPMVGNRIGGVNVFGGGLALYGRTKVLLGGVGVSGDTSCTDHMVAWRLRNLLDLDYVPRTGAVTGDSARPDNIVYNMNPLQPSSAANQGGVGVSPTGFGHPKCDIGPSGPGQPTFTTTDPKLLPEVKP